MNTEIKKKLASYTTSLAQALKAGNATEHTHRPALKTLLESLADSFALSPIQATNEPKRIACGAPDYVVSSNQFIIGYSIHQKTTDTSFLIPHLLSDINSVMPVK